MSKRRINLQQSARIEKKQTHYQKAHETNAQTTTSNGLVITRFRQEALVESTENKRAHCSIRPTIDSIVAGDRVVFQHEGDHQGVIVSRYPRHSVLGRPDKQGQIKPVAANISQVMVVVTPKPEISWVLLDSYLVMADYLKLPVCIVLNKTDLPHAPIKQQLLEQYQPLDYTILLTNQTDKTGHQDLQKILDNQTSVFVGQSGVGKSSLIAEMLPQEPGIKTRAISSRNDLGTHTTSQSRLYHIPTGGALIDSPGVREVGLWHMPAVEIAKGYREFKPFIPLCKFRNCNHQNTIGCALLEAVKKNLVSRNRYENYVKLATQFAR